MKPARVMLIEIQPEVIVELLLGRAKVVFVDIPPDARVRHTSIDPFTGCVMVQVESAALPLIKPGDPLLHAVIALEAL